MIRVLNGTNGFLNFISMINDNWFVKGVNSQHITLSSYVQLQEAYLDNSQNSKLRHRFVIFPNKQKSTRFEDYFFILMAMSGEHAFYLKICKNIFVFQNSLFFRAKTVIPP